MLASRLADVGEDQPAEVQMIRELKIEMCEINAGWNGRAALLADPAHCVQQLPGIRPGRQRGMQAITIAARHQRPRDEIRPVLAGAPAIRSSQRLRPAPHQIVTSDGAGPPGSGRHCGGSTTPGSSSSSPSKKRVT